MFEHDRSAARGEMTTRKLVVFRHASALGSARAQDLFGRVKAQRLWQGEAYAPGDPRLDNAQPARSFADYAITVNRDRLPEEIEIIEY
jgi:CRISPR-associated protein Csd2